MRRQILATVSVLALGLGGAGLTYAADNTTGNPTAPGGSAMPSATAPAPHGYTDGGNAQPSQPSMSGTSQWGGSQHMSSRDEIIAAQEKLQQENLYHGKIDGLLGPETRQALRDYQRQHGLRVTENLDQATKNSLLGTTGQGSSTPPTSPSPGAGDRRPSQ